MNKLVPMMLTSMLLMSSYQINAKGYHDNTFYVQAKVVEVTPIYQKVMIKTSRTTCKHRDYRHNNYDSHRQHHSALPTVTGAVIGGVVGNQVLRKSKLRGIGTVAGALIGGVIGNDISQTNHKHYSHSSGNSRRYCKTHYETRNELTGYQVTYRYHGETFITRTHKHPGRSIDIKIQVDPV